MNKSLVIVAVCFAIALGCNNYCNGHGTCGAKDRCDCYPGWGGSDCSLRSCPYGEAFVDTILGDINHDGKLDSKYVKTEWNPIVGKEENLQNTITTTGRIHRYAECSNAGLCNRLTGDCECFEGYEGSACQRRFCPSNGGEACSGHGECISIRQYVNQRKSVEYVSWETEKFYKCVCDPNWDGIDCSERVCPKGLDPITQYASPITYQFFIETRDLNGFSTDNKVCKLKDDTSKSWDCSATAVSDSLPYYVDNFVIKYQSKGITYTSPVINGRAGTCPTQENGKPTIANYGNTAPVDDSKEDKSITKKALALEPSDSNQFQEEIKRAIRRIPPLSQVNVTVSCAKPEDETILKKMGNKCNSSFSLTDNTKPDDENGIYCEDTSSLFRMKRDKDSAGNEYAGYYYGYIVTIQMEYADRDAASGATMTIEKTMKTVQKTADKANPTFSTITTPISTSQIYTINPTILADTCSNRGVCDRTTGFCECFPGYYGYACDNQRKLPIAQ